MKSSVPQTSVSPLQSDENSLSSGSGGTTLAPPVFQLAANPAQGVIQRQTPGENLVCEPETERSPEEMYCEATDHDASWMEFAEKFNQEFQSTLHAFETKSLPDGGDTEKKTSDKPGSQSGPWLDVPRLQELFTEGQREKLMSFMSSGQIPDRLFNGDETGGATAQQRILLSAHILTRGTYKPGSFEQKVHARMCFHWVHIVHHYAGATPQNALKTGVMGNFDHDGNAILGTGKLEQVHFGKKVMKDELPDQEEGDIGPLPDGSSHEAAGKREDEKVAANPEKKRGIHRRRSFPLDRFGEIQSGDWLWYYNANGSGGGGHSVIFSRWATDEQVMDGVKYRVAIVFSQGTPNSGGREHTARLGGQYHKGSGGTICPITWVSRVSENTRPAQTADEILPKGSEKQEQRLSATNEKYLKSIEKRNKKPVDLGFLKDNLRAECRENIEVLGERLTDKQREMLLSLTQSEDLEDLVRLTQRLREMGHNAQLLTVNMEKTYDEKLNDKHAEVSVANAAVEADKQKALAEVDEALSPLLAQIEELEKEQDGLVNPNARIQELARDNRILKGKIRSLKRKVPKDDPELLRMVAAQEALSDQIDGLIKERSAYFKDRSRLKKEIRTVNNSATKLKVKRRILAARYDKKMGKLPYGMAHPGRLGSQKKIKVNGKLEEVYDRKAMKAFLQVTE